MLVSNRMTKDPVTVVPDDLLIQGRLKMQKGSFRRLRLRSGDTDTIAKVLRNNGFEVLGVYPVG